MSEAFEKIDKVYAEIDKVITKFSAMSEHSSRLMKNEISSLELLKSSFADSKHLENCVKFAGC